MSPDDAFAALGNETRIETLRVLGDADRPLPFSELKDRVGMRDSGQFNYHLDELRGHFVRQVESEYVLSQTGQRVVEAILSGTVTDAPVVEPTEIDQECHFCGGTVAISYQQEQVDIHCTECDGRLGESLESSTLDLPADFGWLGALPLPPAGVRDRDPEEVLLAATTLGQSEYVAASQGVCPRCSATVSRELRACPDHHADDGICSTCGHRREVLFSARCRVCNFATGGGPVMALFSDADFLSHLLAHGINPVAPDSTMELYGALHNYDVEIDGPDATRVTITHTLGDDTFTKTLGDELPVTTSRETA